MSNVNRAQTSVPASKPESSGNPSPDKHPTPQLVVLDGGLAENKQASDHDYFYGESPGAD